MADENASPSAPTPFPWETIMWIIVEGTDTHPTVTQALEAMRNAEVAWNVMLRNGVGDDTAIACAGQIAVDFLAPSFGDRWSAWSPPTAVT